MAASEVLARLALGESSPARVARIRVAFLLLFAAFIVFIVRKRVSGLLGLDVLIMCVLLLIVGILII